MFKSIKFRMMFIYGLLIILIVRGLSWFAYNRSADVLRKNLYEEAANNASLTVNKFKL